MKTYKRIPYLYNLSHATHDSWYVSWRLYLAQAGDKIQSVEKCPGGTAKPHLATIAMYDSI